MTEFKCPAPFKRAEQLKRWQESETNEQSTIPKNSSRIRFSVDCVFLAACAAGDKDEVLRLVRNGADVNTPSVDGLTALHQACIDNKLHMVEFLIKLGANVNHSDNEGWTPLHATASCGFYDIAQFLLDHGANLCAVNNEGELPVDLAEPGPTKQFLLDEIQEQGIDCEKARTEEERLLLDHAKTWYVTKSTDAESPDPKTGATPLHIAAAKGYLKVMQILLGSCGVDVDPVDLDGWTPLHASAHWGQPEAATVLVQHGADMDIKNFVGQTCFDVAAPDMIEHLQDLKDRHENIALSIYNKQKRRPPVPEDLPSKLKKVEVQIENKFDNIANNKKTVEKKNALNLNSFPSPVEGKPPKIGGGASSPLSPNESSLPEDEPSWRHSSRQKPQASALNDKESPTSQPENDIILRRTPSDPEKLSPQNKVKKDTVLPTPTNPSTARSMVENTNDQSETNKNSSSDPPTSKIFPGNIFKNFFKSFVPPVRDEESETQRKAHAKRVRETRRSTQGVTLDEIKSAEQLVKKKNSLQIDKTEPEISVKKDASNVDSENSQKDTQNHKEEIRDSERVKESNNVAGEPVDTETTVTIALPRSSPVKKDDESRVTTQAAQNVIQRRKRPKRRSTGLVNVDLDEITPDQSGGEGAESGFESTELNEPEASLMKKSEENNDVDYKTLLENSERENNKLQEIILQHERELTDVKQKLEEYTSRLATASENEKREKREKRAMERKMSEMEEELKCLHNLQTENKRLKDENGALIRVISKLSK